MTMYLPQGDDEPHQVHDHADMAEPALDVGPPSLASHPWLILAMRAD